jgi:hypothetical protein
MICKFINLAFYFFPQFVVTECVISVIYIFQTFERFFQTHLRNDETKDLQMFRPLVTNHDAIATIFWDAVVSPIQSLPYLSQWQGNAIVFRDEVVSPNESRPHLSKFGECIGRGYYPRRGSLSQSSSTVWQWQPLFFARGGSFFPPCPFGSPSFSCHGTIDVSFAEWECVDVVARVCWVERFE